VFLHGIITLVDKGGQILFYRDKKNHKYKSVALSPNGRYILLHGKHIDGNDFLEMVDTVGNESLFFSDIKIKIPHKIYMAVNNFGDSVINFPQAAMLADSSGKVKARIDAKNRKSSISIHFLDDYSFEDLKFPENYVAPMGGVYHPVTSNNEYFVIGRGHFGLFIRRDGSLIYSFSKIRKSYPWKFEFSADGSIMCIENGDILRYFHLKNINKDI